MHKSYFDVSGIRTHARRLVPKTSACNHAFAVDRSAITPRKGKRNLTQITIILHHSHYRIVEIKNVCERTRRDFILDLPRTRTWNLLIRSQVRYPITPADPQGVI